MTPDTLATVAAALADQQAGRLHKSEAGFRAALDREANEPLAAQLLGVLLRRSGRIAEALDVLRRGASANPDHAGVHLALADTLQAAGARTQAIASYRSVLAIEPGSISALVNLANALRDANDPAGAIAACRTAIAVEPRCAEAHATLGSALLATGDADAAKAAYTNAVGARPGFALGWAGLGMARLRLDLSDQALVAADEAIRMDPRLAEAWFVRGTALSALRRPAEAIASLERASVLDPSHARAHLNLGNAYAAIDDHVQAEAGLRTAIRLDPAIAEAHASLGHVLTGAGRLDEATAACEAAISLQPDFAQAHWNLSFARLLAGDFERGWQEYEWRKRHQLFAGHFARLPGAEWHGEMLAGRTLLVHAEQGLGDTIQFARYLPVLASQGAKLTVACDTPLIPLLAAVPGVALVVRRDLPLPGYDLWVDQMSLPNLLGTTLHTIPAAAGYLSADPALAETWRARLPPGRCVGVVWRGNPAHSNDARRSMPTEALAPILAVPDINFVSLQVGPCSLAITQRYGVPDRSSDLTDFARTAALVASLDLVIAVDTATAHLAGALGRPTWLMIPSAPDWRWLFGRVDSPWYSSMRLFRQSKPGDWNGVTARVAAALREQAAEWQGGS